jgi:hypothetical protein
MKLLKVDIWLEVIQMLCFYADESTDIMQALKAIDPVNETDPKTFLKIVVDKIELPVIARKAAELFYETYSSDLTSREMVEDILKALHDCENTKDETTFIILLKCFNNLNYESVRDYFEEQNIVLLKFIKTIEKLIIDFKKFSSLHTLVESLKIICKIKNFEGLTSVREFVKGLFEKLQTLRVMEINDRVSILEKLVPFFEWSSWTLLNEKSMVQLYNFCIKYSYMQALSKPTIFHRLHVNLIRYFWMLTLAQKQLPIETKKLAADVKKLNLLLRNAIKLNLTPQEYSIAIVNIFDLCLMFQPQMETKYDCELFRILQIDLSKELLRDLVDKVSEKVLYADVKMDDHLHYYKTLLMQHFASFYCDYMKLPSVTCWEPFLRHYNAKFIHKKEIEILMTKALDMKKSIFEKTVAFAILNISTYLLLDQFKSFYNALDAFLRLKIPDKKHHDVVIGIICSIVLERLSRLIIAEEGNVENRLNVLDYVLLMTKNVEISIFQNLAKYVTFNNTHLDVKEVPVFTSFMKNFNT